MSVMESLRVREQSRNEAPVSGDADGHNFRLAMREFASGVSIIACGEGRTRNGCTATALTSLSLSPPSIIVCLSRQTATLTSIKRSGAFSANILAGHHQPLAERFAGRGGLQGADRFGAGDWLQLVTGSPVLADALASIDCRLDEIIERNTHSILIGAVKAVRVSEAAPALLHWRSGFETL